jgi:hypothetical protein
MKYLFLVLAGLCLLAAIIAVVQGSYQNLAISFVALLISLYFFLRSA